jgi:hypothetical protein
MSGQEVSCPELSGLQRLSFTPLLSDAATQGWNYEHLSSVRDATRRVSLKANHLAT